MISWIVKLKTEDLPIVFSFNDVKLITFGIVLVVSELEIFSDTI